MNMKGTIMGEIIDSLDKFIEDFEINNTTPLDMTIKDLKEMCVGECKINKKYDCPLIRKHIGCLFRSGKTPREW